ncbi:MAG: hypothetical protein R3E10_14220 [Gemmatimonadota bacterium]
MKGRATVVATLLLLIAACGHGDITSPEGQLPDLGLTVAQAPNPWVYRVTGGAAGFDPSTGLLGTGEINVAEQEDGSVSGRFSFNFRFVPGRNVNDVEAGLHFVSEADCLVVEGNTAWISGVVTVIKDFDFPVPTPPPGNPFMVIVEDNGPANDRVWFGRPRDLSVVDCNDRPPHPGGSQVGNLTIHRR